MAKEQAKLFMTNFRNGIGVPAMKSPHDSDDNWGILQYYPAKKTCKFRGQEISRENGLMILRFSYKRIRESK